MDYDAKQPENADYARDARVEREMLLKNLAEDRNRIGGTMCEQAEAAATKAADIRDDLRMAAHRHRVTAEHLEALADTLPGTMGYGCDRTLRTLVRGGLRGLQYL